jgi:hypothetical protein
MKFYGHLFGPFHLEDAGGRRVKVNLAIGAVLGDENLILSGKTHCLLEKLKVGHPGGGIIGIIKIKEFSLPRDFPGDALQVWKKFIIRSYGKPVWFAAGKDGA